MEPKWKKLDNYLARLGCIGGALIIIVFSIFMIIIIYGYK